MSGRYSDAAEGFSNSQSSSSNESYSDRFRVHEQINQLSTGMSCQSEPEKSKLVRMIGKSTDSCSVAKCREGSHDDSVNYRLTN